MPSDRDRPTEHHSSPNAHAVVAILRLETPSPLPRGRGRGEGCNHSRPTKSDSVLSGNDGWRINLRFHSMRKGQFRFNPLPTSTLKSRGGVHVVRPRPSKRSSWSPICSCGRRHITTATPSPLPRGRGWGTTMVERERLSWVRVGNRELHYDADYGKAAGKWRCFPLKRTRRSSLVKVCS